MAFRTVKTYHISFMPVTCGMKANNHVRPIRLLILANIIVMFRSRAMSTSSDTVFLTLYIVTMKHKALIEIRQRVGPMKNMITYLCGSMKHMPLLDAYESGRFVRCSRQTGIAIKSTPTIQQYLTFSLFLQLFTNHGLQTFEKR